MNTKILSSINVKGSNIDYRNYLLEHSITDLDYEKLIKITEKSGDNSVSLNPTVFEYNDSNQIMSGSYFNHTLDKSFDYDKFSAINADFDGNGSDDYLFIGNQYQSEQNKLWLYKNVGSGGNPISIQLQINISTKIHTLFPSTILTGTSASGYKLKPEQAFTVVNQLPFSQTISFDTYALSSNTIALDQTKSIIFPCNGINASNFDKIFLPGDFNGDGITDNVMIIGSYPFSNGNCLSIQKDVYFIDLRKDITTNYNKYCGKIPDINPTSPTSNNKITANTDIQVLDFNGDGKSDFVIFDYNGIRVFTFNSTFTGMVQLCHITGEIFNYSSKKYIGDFNGDGKSDIVMPSNPLNNNGNWKFYISNGLTFVSFTKNLGINYDSYRKQYVEYEYNGNILNVSGTVTKETYIVEETIFFVKDFNGDGKSDIMFQKHIFKDLVRSRYFDGQGNLTEFVTDIYQSGQTIEKFLKLYSNKSIASNDITFSPPITRLLPSSKIGAILLTTNINKPDFLNLDYTYIVGKELYSISSSRNHAADVLLKKVTLGNGVSESITYQPLKFQETIPIGSSIPVYNYTNTPLNYPNFDIKNATSLNLVTMVERQSSTVYNKKLFSYDSAVTNNEGLGFLGFKSTMQTNWFNDDSKIISNISIADINLRGAIAKSFVVSGLVSPTYNYNPPTFISKTINTYNTNALQVNKVFKLKMLQSQQYNGLDNTSLSVINQHNSNNNLTQITSTTKNGATTEQITTAIFNYDLPIANPYMIDRLKAKNSTTTILPSNNVTSSEELYTYNANLLKQVKKKGHNTNYITEDYEHDIYGNITKKTLTATGMTNRVTAFEYDATSRRFITKKTDIEGLITQYAYNQATGTLSSETLPSNAGFPLITNFEYDKWGKKTKVIDFLGKELIYTYENISNGGVKLTTNRSDASSEIIVTDDLGRKTHEGSKLIDDKWSYVSTVYDNNDKPILKSQPYFETLGLGNYPVWNEMKYDIYGRLIETKTLKSNSSPGKISTYTYNGLTTTESDSFKSKQTIKNSIGQVISVTDSPNGGTIIYSYYANGNLKQTNFEGVITTIEQDGWGRKTKLIDPSAGTYQYQYNEFGETIKEIAPKGVTTYTFDNFGKVTQKTIIGLNGDPTNSKTVYTYNPTTKLLTNIRYDDFIGGFFTLYSYGYDNYKRLNFSDESGFNAYYQRATHFDSFGRPEKELYTAINTYDSKRSDIWVRNSYKNGLPWQIIDNATNKILWQTNNTNATGKITSGNYGNDIKVTNNYDTFGFPNYLNHDFGTTNIMYLETLFEPIRGNLVERYNGMFGFFYEEFQHDSLDRLSAYTDINVSQVTQTYDNLGRIDTSPIGTHNYAISGKAFQNSSVSLTPEADAYYQSRSGLDITYNSFKSPININEQGKDKLSFIYNLNNDRSSMYYGGLQDDKYLRPLRKHYSADGSMEIKQNIATGTTEFITYIGGDAYSAPIILKSDGTTKKYYYLHRDYQSSIVAITNEVGAIVEKRRFDVWGNIAEVKDGAGNNLNKLTFIDRGYTGHEHLQGVVLIHMNGRLYDPMVHRFLQPDNNIQDPYNTQNYNRYSYVMNNPTKYTDPTGEFWSFVVSALFNAYKSGFEASGGQLNPFKWDSTTWINAGLGAAGSAASTASTNYLNAYIDNYGKNDTPKDFGGGNPVEEHGYVVVGYNSNKSINDYYNYKENIFKGKWIDIVTSNLEYSSQSEDFTCTYHCKVSVDMKFFKTADREVNEKWYNDVYSNGLRSELVIPKYKSDGYQVNDSKNANRFTFAISEMNLGRVVQISWMPISTSPNLHHASLINTVQQNATTLEYRFILMDPARWSGFSVDKIQTMFSLWR
jgi:RHS repeat-associated protein